MYNWYAREQTSSEGDIEQATNGNVYLMIGFVHHVISCYIIISLGGQVYKL